MDAVSIDHLLRELRPSLLGEHIARVRAGGADAMVLELGRGGRLWCEAGREAPGLYLLHRDQVRRLAEATEPARSRTRQALLLARKHLEGARIGGVERVAGSRTIVLETTRASLALRSGGAAPALTLALGGEPVATIGEGPAAWPPPPPEPLRDWDRLHEAQFVAEVEQARARGFSEVRAILSACPALGPALARLLAQGMRLDELRARIATGGPTLVTPGPLEGCADADLAESETVVLLPFAPHTDRTIVRTDSWQAAAHLYLQARLRGARFRHARRAALEAARTRTKRLLRLEAHLQADFAGLPDAQRLRRQAEALLAHAGAGGAHGEEVEVTDPYDPTNRLAVRVDARLSLPANADRLFERARRVERAQDQIEARLRETRDALQQARLHETRVLGARDLAEVERPEDSARVAPPAARAGGQPRYLTSRGLSLLVGRGARENHRLTFEVAAPEDWWLHARDVPGAHVVLRDPERRAAPEDLREAAEVAAFFSQAREQSQADVHVARRKHVRPAGTPGRVRVMHSETLRVVPRDPEGRLRKR